MKKNILLAILFFSGLWGLSEALLGGVLYRTHASYASVPLTIIGFAILAFARARFLRPGIATLIAACAMFYKFLNAPFFVCHLLGILLMGLCFDLIFAIRPRTHLQRAWAALIVTYLNYTLFALMITFLFRYPYWVQGGWNLILQHIAFSGTLAALGAALLVPLAWHWAEKYPNLTLLGAPTARIAPRSLSLATLALWLFGITTFFFNF